MAQQWLQRIMLLSIAVVWRRALPSSHRIQQYTRRSVRFDALQQAVKDGKVRLGTAVGILCHAWLFPAFLTIYLLVLLVDQTNLFGWKRYPSFTIRDQSRLLFMSIVTGGASALVDDEKYAHRFVVQESSGAGRLYILLCLLLGLVGTHIIHQQTIELGRVSFIIAALAGRLLILVGFLLLEEEEITT